MSVRSWGAGMVNHFSCVRLCATLWTVTCQAPLSMRFSRQEYRSGLPYPSPGDLPDPGIEPVSLMSPALAGRFLTWEATWEALTHPYTFSNVPVITCQSCVVSELIDPRGLGAQKHLQQEQYSALAGVGWVPRDLDSIWSPCSCQRC